MPSESSLLHPAPAVRVKRVLFAAFLLATMFQTFGAFPYFGPIQESWNVVCALYLLYVLFFPLPRRAGLNTSLEKYMIAVIAIVPVWAGVCASSEFGQPIVYGMLGTRSMILIAVVLFFARALRRGYFTLGELERALLVLAWGTLIVFTWMRASLDPANFREYPGIVAAASDDFRLPSYFTTYGTLYYGLRGVRSARISDYFCALVFLAGEIGSTSRTIIVSLLFALLVLAWSWIGWRRFLMRLPAIMLVLGMLAGSVYLLVPQQTSERLGQFSDAFNVLLGKQVQDSSAQWHYVEIFMALPAIAKHSIVGNGRLSNQWEGGGDEVRGEHFIPEDVGILGALYQFGILGLAFFGFQYWIAISWNRRLGSVQISPLLDAAKGFLLFTAVLSVIDNSVALFAPQISLFFVVVLRGFAEIDCLPCAAARPWLAAFIIPDRSVLG